MENERRDDRSEHISPPNLDPAALAATSRKQFEDLVSLQVELFDKFKDSNNQWFERMQTEASLASNFASRLSAARSLPDAMAACQDWYAQHFEMMAEDGKHMFADAQKAFETGAHLFSNGWWTNGKGGMSS